MPAFLILIGLFVEDAVRKLFTYAKSYGGDNPTFSEGDVFRTSVLLDKANDDENDDVNDNVNDDVKKDDEISDLQFKILNVLHQNPRITQDDLSKQIGFSKAHVFRSIKLLKEKGYITRIGSDKRGTWVVKFP